MARLQELKDKRMKVLEKILENQDICKLLYYDTAFPLEQPNIDDTWGSIFMKRVFPLTYIPTTQDTTGSLLSVYFSDISAEGVYFKNIRLKFVVMSHHDSWMNMETGDLRPDFICEKIDEMFNSENGFGIGKILFESRREIYPSDKFAGYIMTYNITEFN
jgi:hypothetical protein